MAKSKNEKKKIVLRKSCYLIVEASIRISKPLEENCKKKKYCIKTFVYMWEQTAF